MRTANESERHDRFLGMIERQFRGELGADQSRELHEHLRACSVCERAFEQWAVVERALYGADSGAAVSLGQQARVAHRLFEAPPPRRSFRSMVAGVSAVAAAAAALVVFLNVRPAENQDRLQARSGSDPALSRKVSFRVLRARADLRGGYQVSDLGSEGGEVRAGDRLRVVYSNHSDLDRIDVWMQRDDRPAEVVARQVAVAPEVEDQSVGDAIDVSEDWRSGAVRFWAVFTRAGKADSHEVATLIVGDEADRSVRRVEARVLAADDVAADGGRAP